MPYDLCPCSCYHDNIQLSNDESFCHKTAVLHRGDAVGTAAVVGSAEDTCCQYDLADTAPLAAANDLQ